MPNIKPWVMPAWMEPFRWLIMFQSGGILEDLMNDNVTNVGNDPVKALMIASVRAQLLLLEDLRRHGFISDVPSQSQTHDMLSPPESSRERPKNNMRMVNFRASRCRD
jgi:hypothetical protein